MAASPPLYLSGEAIRRLAVPSARFRDRLAEAFRLRSVDEPVVEPKRAIPVGPGHFFQSMVAASAALGYAAVKWVGVSAANAGRGHATVQATIVLSDHGTGAPVAILDGASVTVLRTAAMSALAASFLARPEPRSIGFVGCGEQAHGHLDALGDLCPSLVTALCLSRSTISADRLVRAAQIRGLSARTTRDPADVLACDVVVTSIGFDSGRSPFLDAGALRPGSFVAAVDLGAPWRPETFGAFDFVATDDRRSAEEPSTRKRITFPGRFDADLAALCAGAVVAAPSSEGRRLFVFPGTALADLTAAIVLFEAARDAGEGLLLPP